MAKRKVNKALLRKLPISAELAAIIGPAPVSRGEMMKKIWVYIKKKKLQDPDNMRNIIADEKLKLIFGRKKVVSMFEMTKLLSKHIGDEFGKKRNPSYDYEDDEDDYEDDEDDYEDDEDDYDDEEEDD